MIWLITLAIARAEPVALVVGASTWWDRACGEARGWEPACTDPERALDFTDDDAWRYAYLLGGSLPEDRILVFTSPDAAVAARGFPGGPPRPATLDAMVSALETLDTTGPLELRLYVAAHGTEVGVHLDDRLHTFGELREALLEAREDTHIELVVADVCLSARWRGRGDAVARRSFPPVGNSAHGYVEASVDSVTPESEALRGGHFTYLVNSALVGSADLDEDGTITAQELSDHVYAYLPSIGVPFDPTVRAPNGVPHAVVADLTGPASLAVGDQEGAARWVVGLERNDERVLLAEAFTHAGEHRALHLPPGAYLVWRLPYELGEQGYGRYRLAERSARACRVQLQADTSTPLEGCEGAPVRLASLRGGGAGGTVPELDQLLAQLPAAVPEPLPRQDHRYHEGDRHWLDAGLALESGFLGRGQPLVGPAFTRRWPSRLGGSLMSVDLRLARELGDDHPSTGYAATLAFTADRSLWTRRALRAGALLRGGAQAFLLAADAPYEGAWRASPAPVLDLGPSLSLSPGRLALRLEASWAPRLVLIEDDMATEEGLFGSLAGAPDALRLATALTAGLSW